MRVRIPHLPLETLSPLALMVKRRSFPASNGAFQVRILVEALDWIDDGYDDGRATRLATGTGWKPVEHLQCLAGSTPAPSAMSMNRHGRRTTCLTAWALRRA